MSDESDAYEIFGGCGRDGCSEPCPFDMVSVIFDRDVICCSPDCAMVVLESLETAPETVTLHEPQGHVDRDDLGIGRDSTDLTRPVESKTDAEDAIREIADLYPGRFRIAHDSAPEE